MKLFHLLFGLLCFICAIWWLICIFTGRPIDKLERRFVYGALCASALTATINELAKAVQ